MDEGFFPDFREFSCTEPCEADYLKDLCHLDGCSLVFERWLPLVLGRGVGYRSFIQ